MKSSPLSFLRRVNLRNILLLLLTASASRGATISWTNTSGGNWGNSLNWSTHTVPGSSDAAQITAAGTYTVTMDITVQVSSITLGGASGHQTLSNATQAVTIGSGTVASNGILSIGAANWTGGPLTVQGTFNWSGATVAMPVTVATGGILNFGASGGSLQSPLTNSGTINWTGPSSTVFIYNNHAAFTGLVNNRPGGLFLLQNDQSINSAGYGFEAFINAGTVRKTAGTGSSSISVSFTNTGTVDSQVANIHFNSGGTIGGTYNTASNCFIEFDSGNYFESGAVTVSGSGTCRLYGANVTLNDRITKFILAAGNVMLSPTFESTGTIQNLQLDGAMLVGAYTVTGTLGINGGGLATASPLTVATNGSLDFNGAASVIYSALTNSGTINWSGSSITIYNNNSPVGYTGLIRNMPTGTINLQSDQALNSAGYGFEFCNNAGAIHKIAGLGQSSISVAFTNSGTVDAQTGTIAFSTGGNVGGTYNTASGAIIQFSGGNFTQSGVTAAITGSGVCKLNGATVTLSNNISNFLMVSGNVALATNFETNGTIQNLQLDGAMLTGTNIVTGKLGMDGGGLAQSSPLTVATNGTLNFNGAAVVLYSPLTNSGTVNWTGSTISVYNNNVPTSYTGFIKNMSNGTFNLLSDQTINTAGYGFEYFNNAGTIRKTSGLGQTAMSLAFTNTGLIDVQSGSIAFTTGGNVGGTYNTAAGAIAQFTGGNFIQTNSVSITGTGISRLNGANLTLNNNIPGFSLFAGNVSLATNFETNGTIQNLQLDGAILNGTNTVTGTLGINGGGLASASPLTVAASGVLNFNGAAVYLYAPLTNFGTINWAGNASTLTVYNNAAAYTGTINNQPGGLLNIQCDQTVSTGGYGFETIANHGTIRKTAGLGTTTCNVAFSTDGTLDTQSGILRFSGPFSQSGGTMNFGITSLAYYGQIAFNANAPFTGTLSVNFNPGYSPSAGDTFSLVSYATESGAFTSLALPPAAVWQTSYNATTFTLSVLSVNAGAGGVSLPPIGNRSINAGAVLSITNTASDSNPTNHITYSLTAAPAGATINSNTAVIQWRPAIALAGTTNFFTEFAIDNGIPPASNSVSFNVTVNPLGPIVLTPVSLVGGHFTAQISGFVGPDYTFMASSNMSNWVGLSTNTPAVLPFTVTDTNAGAFSRRFYRAKLGP